MVNKTGGGRKTFQVRNEDSRAPLRTTLLLKLMNYNKDIPLISAGALPRISDGTGVKSMGRSEEGGDG